MVLTDTNRSTGEKKTSVPLCTPQIPRLKVGSEGLVTYKVSLKFGSEVQVSYNVCKLIPSNPVLIKCLRKITTKHINQTQLSSINGTVHCYMFRLIGNHHQAIHTKI
jgi:hypothetical protein